MADFEFKDSTNIQATTMPPEIGMFLWAWFDANKDKGFKLKWGWFRLSFTVAILEPLFVQIAGPRPA